MLDNLFVPPSWNLDDCFGRQYNNTIVDIMWKGAQTGQIESRFNCSNIITQTPRRSMLLFSSASLITRLSLK